jgi:hypothetical protein
MKKQVIVAVTAAVIIVVAFAGVIVYFNNQIADLRAENANLATNNANLKAPHLVTDLLISEVHAQYANQTNHLLITGTLTNEGLGSAENAGLHIVANDINGTKIIDMTVPANAASYGSGSHAPNDLFTIESEQSYPLDIAIYHSGVAGTWEVTPVCSNAP